MSERLNTANVMAKYLAQAKILYIFGYPGDPNIEFMEQCMASATARHVRTCADLDLAAKFNGREPGDYRDILRAMGQGAAR